MKPPELIDTQWSDDGNGGDRYPDSMLDFAFVAGPEAAATGFVTDTTLPGSITLTFTDFNVGESFTFTIDVDDNNARVDSWRIAGATVTATFDVGGSSVGGTGGTGLISR